jgi:glutamate N-acetyltransferase / amino-acid N-acetyltransferase
VRGEPQPVDEARAKTIIQEEDVEVSIELGMGSEGARYWTCDFSHVSLARICTLTFSSFR